MISNDCTHLDECKSPKDGVLLIAHGSRAKRTERVFEAIAAAVRKRLPDLVIEIAYMEFGEPTIRGGLDILKARGITRIRAMPYFLFEGIHISVDIARALNEYMASNPDVQIAICSTLSSDDDERLADIVADRIMGC